VREIEAAHEQRSTVDIAVATAEEPLPERPDPAQPPREVLTGPSQSDREL
jgi:hypothetical protein